MAEHVTARQVPYGSIRTLQDVGPLHLRPGGTRLVDHLRSEPWRLDDVTVFETRPSPTSNRVFRHWYAALKRN